MSGLRFEGKVAIVTGAANGIGRASAERLSGDGANVVVVDIDAEAAERTAASLSRAAIAVQADVSSEDDVQHYMDAALKRFGQVDLYHLNAGIFGTFTRSRT